MLTSIYFHHNAVNAKTGAKQENKKVVKNYNHRLTGRVILITDCCAAVTALLRNGTLGSWHNIDCKLTNDISQLHKKKKQEV